VSIVSGIQNGNY